MSTQPTPPTAPRRWPAAKIFLVLFWLHQLLFGVPSALFGIDLLMRGNMQGLIPAIGLLLAWVGGTLTWGFASLLHQLA